MWVYKCSVEKHQWPQFPNWEHHITHESLVAMGPHCSNLFWTQSFLVLFSNLTKNSIAMSFPSPITSLIGYLTHLMSLGLDSTITTFKHYQGQPVPTPEGHYDKSLTQDWCDRMDALLVSHSIFICSTI